MSNRADFMANRYLSDEGDEGDEGMKRASTSKSLRKSGWQLFCENRRSIVSLWLFLILMVICLLADFLANEKPLVVYHQEQWYFPIFEFVPESTYGGFFETEADYHDPYVENLIQEGGGFMLRTLIPYSPETRTKYEEGDAHRFAIQPPSKEHWFGTDDQGRDVLTRLLYGLRISILFGLIYTLGTGLMGIIAGLLQGYYGGYADLFGQRFIEVWSGLPVFFLLIILSSMVEPSFGWLLLFMMVFGWTSLVGLVRAESLRTRNLPYVRAAQSLGVGDMQVLFRHILPNAMVSSLAMLPFMPAASIGMLASLDFLGLGLPIGTPSLGELLKQGKENPQAPWLGIVGFFTMTILFSLIVFIGEGIRDVFDPKKGLRGR